jgi:predicted Zn-dependent protease
MARQQTAGQLWTAAALLGMLASLVNPVLGAAGMAAAQTAQLKYSRDYEQEADYLGLGLVGKAGYDPHALASFFQELLTEQRLNPAGVPPYMLSHPVTQDRVAKVETIIAAQHLSTPPGRPNKSLGLQEAQAVIRAQNGPKEEVLAEYRRAAAAAPKDAVAQFLLGRAYQSVGQSDAARVALEESHRLGGAEGREQRALGAVYLTANRPEDAKKALDTYLGRYPRDPWSHLMFGRAQAATGDEAAAIQEYRRALTLDPEYGDAHRELGLALGRQGKEADGFYHLAIAAREHGDLQQSWGFFQRAAAALPKDDPRQKDIKDALEELKPLVRDTREMGQPQRQHGPLPIQRGSPSPSWGQP